MLQGQRAFETRCQTARFVTAHTAAFLAGLQLHDAPHPLQLIEMLIQRLEVEHLAGRRLELRGTIGFYRHNAQRGLGHIRGPTIRALNLVNRRGIPVLEFGMITAVRAIGHLIQVGADFLAHAQVLDRTAIDEALQSRINVREEKLTMIGLQIDFGRQRRRSLLHAQQRRAHAADRRVQVQQFPVAIAVDQVESELSLRSV